MNSLSKILTNKRRRHLLLGRVLKDTTLELRDREDAEKELIQLESQIARIRNKMMAVKKEGS